MRLSVCFLTVAALWWLSAAPGGASISGYSGGIELPPEELRSWSDSFSHTITSLSRNLTALDYLYTEYKKYNYMKVVNGLELLTKIAEDIERLMKSKVENVERLVKTAESAYENYTFDAELDFDFLNSKKLLSTNDISNSTIYTADEMSQKIRTINLTAEGQFNYMPVNDNTSTVQVPTTVFDRSTKIMNGAYWSEALDQSFTYNFEKDHTQTWQYFCSADGFFRAFPGMKWPRDNKESGIDFFDCRVRSWYLHAAPGPKNVVILVDASGSMKGLRMIIAQSTVKQILNTLDDDDYFNIMRFSDEVRYVDSCFNGSLSLMAATKENKRRLLELIEEDVEASKQANTGKAFEEVFDLFERIEGTLSYKYGPLCNKAILLITDGVAEHHASLFEKRNWPDKRIRVFTFLIGRDVKDDREVKWMACANKGYYSHISTLADVQENVQNYIRILSRPMVIHRNHNSVWTSVYLDHFSSLNAKKGLKFMTSVAMPVFDIKNETKYEGNLLGVMGTDIPIDLLKDLAPVYKLGVNSFAFLINHNGYVLFHPDFRPYRRDPETGDTILNPNFSNMDLTDIILPEHPPEFNELRENILNSRQGSKRLTILQHYDNMRRMVKRSYKFYYKTIINTTFSLGIALPTTFDLRTNVPMAKPLRENLNSSDSQIAPWSYCRNLDKRLRGKERIEKLIDIYENDELRKKYCDEELVNNLLSDGYFTKSLPIHWIQNGNDFKASGYSETGYQPSEDNMTFNRSPLVRHGIELIFFGSKGGLTRFIQPKSGSIPVYLKNRTSPLDATYYKRAVEGMERLASKNEYNFTFSLTSIENFNENTSTVLITAPVVMKDKTMVDVAGVVGMQMKYKHFERIYQDSFRGFRKINCSSPMLSCYLVDDHGYVMAAPDTRHVGLFFGNIEDALMTEFVRKRIFHSHNFTDYQAMCQIKSDDKSRSSGSFLLNPLKILFRGLLWTITEIALFISDFSLTHLIHEWKHVEGTEQPDYDIPLQNVCDYDIYEMDSKELLAFNQYSQLNSIECPNRHKVIGHKPCHKKFTLYHVDFNNFIMGPLNGSIGGCEFIVVRCRPGGVNCTTDLKKECRKTYAVSRVADTNLISVVTANDCMCSQNTYSFGLEQEEITYPYLEQCLKRRQNRYTKKRRPCGDFSKDEDDSKCDGCRLSVSLIVLLLCLLVSRSSLR